MRIESRIFPVRGNPNVCHTVPGSGEVSSGNSITIFMPKPPTRAVRGPSVCRIFGPAPCLFDPQARRPPPSAERAHPCQACSLRSERHLYPRPGRARRSPSTPLARYLSLPRKMGPATGAPGQICTRPLAISCEATHWLNCPMERIRPPCLRRKPGVHRSSKASSFRHHFFPRRRMRSAMRKVSRHRHACRQGRGDRKLALDGRRLPWES